MTPFPSLRLVNLTDEPAFQASKWLKIPVLLEPSEMESLFKELGEFLIFMTSSVTKKGEGLVSHEDFLKCYRSYVDGLKSGKPLPESSYRPYFSSCITISPDHLCLAPVSNDKQLISIYKPVIQMQAHAMDYSPMDEKFRSMMFGSSITWGIMFSYPQIFQNPQTKQVDQILKNENYPNSKLFLNLQKWIRQHTTATTFIVKGKKISAPIRLGNECLSWINSHPQLATKGMQVHTRAS